MKLTIFEETALKWANCKEAFTIPMLMEEFGVNRTQAINIVEHMMELGRVTNIGDIIEGNKVTTEFKVIR